MTGAAGTTANDDGFPKALCMECGKECLNFIEVLEPSEPGGPEELWCYCEECEVDTFHPIPPEDAPL